jgi:hypothetical protein
MKLFGSEGFKPDTTKKHSVRLHVVIAILPVAIGGIGGAISGLTDSLLVFQVATAVSMLFSLVTLWIYWRIEKLIKGLILNITFNVSLKFAERIDETLSLILVIIWVVVLVTLIVKWTRSWNASEEG